MAGICYHEKYQYRMKKILRSAAAAALCAWAAVPVHADIPMEYYRSLDGLKGSDLKNAIHEIVANNVKMLSYGSGNNATWWGFYVTDRTDNNEVIDRYSYDVRYFGSRGSSVSGMNIEHSVANSWWGGTKNNAYKDLFELMPCESKINNTKSNYGMGVVVSGDKGNGCTKVGKDAAGQNMWEPADEWKGDFARDYFYIFTAYQNLPWKTSGECAVTVRPGQYPTLKEWAYTLYLEWARKDKVDELEIKRNDDVYSMQGNRNPYVDFPNLMEYVWGDSTNVAFNPRTSVKSTSASGALPGPEPGDGWETLFANSLLGDDAGFTTQYVIPRPSQVDAVWVNTSEYGWKGTAHVGGPNGSNYSADAILWTPEMDFTGYTSARVIYDQAVNFCDSPADVLGVYVQFDGGSRQEVTVSGWPAGNNWNFVTGTRADIDVCAGKKARIGFRYTSTSAEAATWEIKNIKVEALKAPSSIEELPGNLYDPDSDFDMEPEYYTIDGRRITDISTYSGLVIIRRGSRATKVYVR